MKTLSENEINNLNNDELLKKLLLIQAKGYKKVDDIHFVLMAAFVLVLLGLLGALLTWIASAPQ